MLNPGHEVPVPSSSWYVAIRKPARIVHRHWDAIQIADTRGGIDEMILATHPGDSTRAW